MTHAISTIRFDLPSLDDRMHGAGRLNRTGFAISPRGSLALAHGAEAIQQSIAILLSTQPGERVMRPLYGCPLHMLAFEPNDAATAGLAVHYIREAITLWEPRIRILSLFAENDTQATGAVLTINLEYEIIFSGETDSFAIDINLDGRDSNAISDT